MSGNGKARPVGTEFSRSDSSLDVVRMRKTACEDVSSFPALTVR